VALLSSFRLETDASDEEWMDLLSQSVHPVDSFGYVAKLSGGGVVVRTLAAPQTDKPFYGKVHSEGFSIAESRFQHQLTPFQPLIHGVKRQGVKGVVFEVTLKPHSKARIMSGLHALGGGMLLIGGIIVFPHRLEIAVLTFCIALMFFFFPGFRARISFNAGCEQALLALKSLSLFSDAILSEGVQEGDDIV